MRDTLADWLRLIRARLSRRVAFWVLVSIVIIEALIVVPSYNARQGELLAQLEWAGLSTVQPIANLAETGVAMGDLPEIAGDLALGTVVKGGQIYRATGEPVVEFGELPRLSIEALNDDLPVRTLSSDGRRYDVIWSADELNTDFHVIARLDASQVQAELLAYTWRTFFFILLISIVVTGGTLLAVGGLTIAPVLKLQEHVRAIGSGNVDAYPDPLPTDRNDELGDVMVAVNRMTRRIEERTSELQTANRHLKTLNDRLQRELELAQRIQRSLLPPSNPRWPDLDILCYTHPASAVGGDFYAYSNLKNGVYVVAVGDVSGKGMPAALLMAVSVTSFHTVTGNGFMPNELLVEMDRMIGPYTSSTRQNCALVYAVLCKQNVLSDSQSVDTCQYRLSIANAGCVTPIIRRAGGMAEWIDVGGIPLGVGLGRAAGYQEVELCLKDGDLIVLTSDGVIEATNAEQKMFGFGRLEQAVTCGPTSSAESMLLHLQREVTSFVGDREPHDDVTIVVLQA